MKILLISDYYNSLIKNDSAMFAKQEEEVVYLSNQLLGVVILLLVYVAVFAVVIASMMIGYGAVKRSENGIAPKERILLVCGCVIAAFSIVKIVSCILQLGASVGG